MISDSLIYYLVGGTAVGIQDIGDNVRRLMKLRALTIPKLSGRSRMGTAALSNILNRKAEPRSSTLIKIADALGVSVQDLLSDSPRLQSLRFRSAKSLSAPEKASRDQLKHDTALWLSDYRLLEDLLAQPLKPVLSVRPARNAADAAMSVRKQLGVDSRAPICDIPELAEKAGIKLRIRPFGYKKTFGLSVGEHDGGPAIVVNSEAGIPVERQIFTVAHELAHLLLHKDSYDASREEENAEEEKEANLFAGVLLLPDDALREDWESARGLPWVERVLHIKKLFKVSYLTVLVRLDQIYPGVGLQSLIKDFRAAYSSLNGHDLKDHYEPDAIEAPVAAKDPAELNPADFVEERFARLVREAYEKDLISIGRAGEMLHRSLEDMRQLAHSWQEH
jgi:Zn-dependent peptidase ImmA (M78 family)/transcriptional regulator with XRE-family HTH domain